ncbi:MAG TPA: hypothetical protein VD978_19745 [Azospirillum sp.]|nr:hypothetical protein [Azospirillum sp.]
MLYKAPSLAVLCLAAAACGNTGGDALSLGGTSGSSTGDYTQYSGAGDYTEYTSSGRFTIPPAVVGGIDNGDYPGARQGATVQAGSSGGVAAGPPGGIANNQLDRISQ